MKLTIRELCSGLWFPEGPVAMADGSVLLVELGRGTLTRVTPHGVATVAAQLGGGPNGAALGPDGAVYVCNNGGCIWRTESDGTRRPAGPAPDYRGGWIDRVDLGSGQVQRLHGPAGPDRLSAPNDIVFDAAGGFYFTDVGKPLAAAVERGGVFYSSAEGQLSRVTGPLLTPNGIGLSPDGRHLYFAETEGARLWTQDVEGPGRLKQEPWPSLNGARMLVASPEGLWQRFDSLAVDAAGNLHVATLDRGGITVVSPRGEVLAFIGMPDRYTTNICFGGPDMRTAFITLSGSGRLVAVDGWPYPGQPLHYVA